MSLTLDAKSSFSGDRLRQACIDYLYSIHGNDVEISIAKKVDDEVFEEDEITAKCSGDRKSLRGNCTMAIEFFRNERMIRRLEIPARIKIYWMMPAAIETINAGEEINESQIVMKKADITYLKGNEIVSYYDILGKTAKRNITNGTVITGGLLENGILVHRGDKVRIIAQSGAVRISSTGKALQDAAVGQQIRIQRDGSRNILDGYVARDGSIFLSSK